MDIIEVTDEMIGKETVENAFWHLFVDTEPTDPDASFRKETVFFLRRHLDCQF
jgi:hypothetical protein